MNDPVHTENRSTLATIAAAVSFPYIWLGLFLLLSLMYGGNFFGQDIGGSLVAALLCLGLLNPLAPGLVSSFVARPIFLNLLAREIVSAAGCLTGLAGFAVTGLGILYFLSRDIGIALLIFLAAPVVGGLLAFGVSVAVRGGFPARSGGRRSSPAPRIRVERPESRRLPGRPERPSLPGSSSLDRQGLTADLVGADPDLAESYAGQVFAHEGIPDGNGSTEQVRGVVPSHYDDGGHGIDLVAADAAGAPIPIEVKKYNQPSAARLEDRSIVALEPEVGRWRAQQTLASGEKELPVQQMDDLWARDRWLKLVKSPEGQTRLRQTGVDERYLDYQRLRAAPDLPEWGEILDRRTTVIVSGGGGDAGKRLVDQAIFERRSKRVVKIEM
jgi:hypothetical protein